MEFRSQLLNRLEVQITKEENRSWIEALLTLVSVITITLLFILPSYNKIKLLHQNNLSIKNEYDQLKEIYDNYTTASSYFNSVNYLYQDFSEMRPLNPNPSDTLRKINYYTIKNNIFLSSARLLSKDKGEEIYELKLNGSYNDIKNFFIDVKKDERYYKVSLLNLQSTRNQTFTSKNIELTINLSGYYRE